MFGVLVRLLEGVYEGSAVWYLLGELISLFDMLDENRVFLWLCLFVFVEVSVQINLKIKIYSVLQLHRSCVLVISCALEIKEQVLRLLHNPHIFIDNNSLIIHFIVELFIQAFVEIPMDRVQKETQELGLLFLDLLYLLWDLDFCSKEDIFELEGCPWSLNSLFLFDRRDDVTFDTTADCSLFLEIL